MSEDLLNIVSSSRFLVLGGAGSIGQSVTKKVFKRNPVKLHIVDIGENNLVELVRDIRSSYGYIDGDFKTFAIDMKQTEYDAFIEYDGLYDYVINLSALKHVRSEEDSYTCNANDRGKYFQYNQNNQTVSSHECKKIFLCINR